MSLSLFKPELDVWEPGEHNGTFRGNNPAFVTATAALDTYWADDPLEKQTLARGEQVERALLAIAGRRPSPGAQFRGRGLVWGLEFADGDAGRQGLRAAPSSWACCWRPPARGARSSSCCRR